MCICSASIRLICFFAPLAVISNAQSTTTFDSGCSLCLHSGQVSSKASLFKDSPCTFFIVWLFGWHSLTLPLPANPLLEVKFCRFWCYFAFNHFNEILSCSGCSTQFTDGVFSLMLPALIWNCVIFVSVCLQSVYPVFLNYP